MKRTTAVVMMITALGSIFAYGREAYLAATFGVSGSTDAYFAAILIPFSLYSLLGAGALNPVVIPVLAEHVEREPSEEFWRIASIMLNLLALTLGLLTLLGIVFAPQLLRTLAPGFDGETLEVAVRVLRVALPMTFLAGLAAFLAAVLNALGSFVLPALNTLIISGCVVLATMLSGTNGVILAATGWSVGSGLYLLFLLIAITRKRARYHLSLDVSHPAVRRAIQLVLPMALFMLLAQVIPLAQRSLATFFPTGDLSRLNYASRLALLPNTIFSASFALVLLPVLSRQVAANHHVEADESLGRALRATSFFLFPAVVALAIYSTPIVRLVLQRGEFSEVDSVLTAEVMAILALGTIPLGLSTILHDAFYSRVSLWMLLWLGMVNTAVTLGLMLVLQQPYGIHGLAFAFSIGQVTYLLLLILAYRLRLGLIDLKTLLGHMFLVGLASGAMGLVMLASAAVVTRALSGNQRIEQLSTVALGGVLGGLAYLIVARSLRIAEAGEMWKRLQSLGKQGWKRFPLLAGTMQ